PPSVDLSAEQRLIRFMVEGARERVTVSAHDCSDGGLAVALAECCFAGEEPGLGATLDLPSGLRDRVLLFAEWGARMIVTTRDGGRLEALSAQHGVPCARLGTVGGERLTLRAGGRTLV